MSAFDTDVFVLGGGPAGLAAAIAIRQAGLSVMLADALRPPIDKACGEGLMPDSLRALRAMGVMLPCDCGHPFRGIRFQGTRHCVAANFPRGSGLAVRRTVLQPLLAEHARQIGVELLWECPMTGIEGNAVFMGRRRFETRWIIGADGLQSSVRRWAGLESFRRNSRRFSYRRHYAAAPSSDFVEVLWGEGCQIYVTPVNANEIGIALITRKPKFRIADALPQFRTLKRRLHYPTSEERGALAATRRLDRVTQGNVALIGDASGSVDPITGEGLCLAFQQALALASALSAGNLDLYENAHRQLGRRPRFMADFMLLMDRSRFLRERSLAAFESHPSLFAHLLAMHVGECASLCFAAAGAALGWRVVIPKSRAELAPLELVEEFQADVAVEVT